MKKITLSLAVASSLLFAEFMNENPFVTHTEMGYVETGGNTETQTFNLESKAAKDWGHHVAKASVDMQYATNRHIETRNRLVAELTYDYEFTNLLAFNYLAGYRMDRFSGFESQMYTGPGASYKYLVSDEENFTAYGNFLYAVDNY
jgi:putative salt-induced outer membrane protein